MMPYLKIETVQKKAMYVLWFSKRSPLSKCNAVTEVNMEKIHFQIKLSDVDQSSVLHRKVAGRLSTSQKVVDRIQEAWISYVLRKACMLKLFSILQYSFYK
jgi:hypothetical protein